MVAIDVITQAIKPVYTFNLIGEPVPTDKGEINGFSKCFTGGGVYVFFDEYYSPVYVGCSSSMKYRIRQHLMGKGCNTAWVRHNFKYAGFIRCTDEYLRGELEKELINLLQPYGNIKGK